MSLRLTRRAARLPGLFAVLAALAVTLSTTSAQGRERAKAPKVTPGGYVETYYAFNFGRPGNGITNFRAFDNRHATFTLSNAVLSVDAATDRFYARVALQSGGTGETYYGIEPVRPGADGAAAGGPGVFKHVQEAYVGFSLSDDAEVESGLYLSPIGPEAMAIKDTWLWSRSNLFYGLPFYHTGARLKYRPADGVTLRAGVLNGWNSVVDNNDSPSVSLKATLDLAKNVSLDAHYLGGVERNAGDPEGPAWRNLLDTYVTWKATERLEMIVNGDLGFEPNRLGLAGWAAGALFGRFRIHDRVFVAARGDLVMEKRAYDGIFTSSAMLFPTRWLSSQAVAIDVRPVRPVSVRLEYRHDASAAPLFFRGDVAGAGSTESPYVTNARKQDTITLGATAWF